MRKTKQVKPVVKPQFETKYGVNVTLPNTSREKLQVMLELAKSIHILTQAVNGVNTQVNISNNVISNGQTGIYMGTEKTDI